MRQLDYEPKQRRRRGFLGKHNQKATPVSIGRTALIFMLGVAVIWAIAIISGKRPPWFVLAGSLLVAGVWGAIWEWQVDDDEL